MSAETPASHGVPKQDNRFKVWRQTRPFWAGLFTILGGLPIAYLPYGDLRLGNITMAMKTTAGSGALIIGALLITLGLTMWFQPVVRVFAGVATIVLGLVSIPVSNFGGLVIGFLFALVGGGMSASWAPAPPVEEAVDAEGDDERDRAYEDGYDRDRDDEPEQAGTEALYAAGVPEQREAEHHATETTIDAKGGRNSAG
ncbi:MULTISPECIES: DUF6114 domain-containing protein [unclassified Streptomyces]|uniref:DUF6114 domain-containing protein n=1 Tax=unclassified Streptomyces TaxID=2593676 RepID=UPI0006F92395|nr:MULTISPECIES: DUF6114 domain-containing protein [unclassified Streptomyces]KQX47382.1 hypothetical protein ASD33_21540 [Streptomyces sp. Root1304]KRA94689.1 hypothetical protein ASE09_30755 [Streptomyces sp. Root66D1]